MRRMRIRRVCCRAVLGIVCLMFASNANAIELFRTIPLPDDGHGSMARAVNGGIVEFPNVREVAGSKMNAAGMSVPMIWNVNLMSSAAVGVELPLPTGSEGEALGGATFPNGDRIVVGNVSDRGSQWGSFWRMPAMGSWGSPQVLCQDAERSWVSRGDYCGEGFFAVAGSSFEGGVWRAVLHLVTPTDVVTVDLPAPAGSNSAALAVDCVKAGGDPTPASFTLLAGGWITDRQDRMRPVVWVNAGEGWATFPQDIQGADQGQVNGVALTQSGWTACGVNFRAGGSVGFAATSSIGGHEESHGLVQPLAGFADSSADRFAISDSSAGRSANIVSGTSMNPGGSPIPTWWFRGSPVAAQQLLLDPGSVVEVRGFLPNDAETSTLGAIVASSGGQPRACLFRATTTHVPDGIDVPIGKRFSTDDGATFPAAWLWHNDDRELRIRADRAGGVLKAVTDLQFTPLGGPSMPNSIEYRLIARAEGNQPGVTGTLNVYAFNFTSQTWAPAGSFPVTSTASVFSGETGALGLINPQNGAVRLRLEFIADGNRPTVFICNMARALYVDETG